MRPRPQRLRGPLRPAAPPLRPASSPFHRCGRLAAGCGWVGGPVLSHILPPVGPGGRVLRSCWVWPQGARPAASGICFVPRPGLWGQTREPEPANSKVDFAPTSTARPARELSPSSAVSTRCRAPAMEAPCPPPAAGCQTTPNPPPAAGCQTAPMPGENNGPKCSMWNNFELCIIGFCGWQLGTLGHGQNAKTPPAIPGPDPAERLRAPTA